MARLLTPDKLSDKVADRMSEMHPNDTAREALDAARDALERARRSIEDVADRTPEASSIAARLPKAADILAGVPGALEVARRVPTLRDVRSSAEDAASAARESALDLARKTPLRDHPAVRRGPGPLGILARLGLLSAVAAVTGALIVNRERVRSVLLDAKVRLDEIAAQRGFGSGAYAGATWSDSGLGTDEVDDVLLVETVATAEPGGAPGGTLPADEPTSDLDATGWGTEGTPTAPRRLSADVAAMTTPTPTGSTETGPETRRPEELGE